MSGIYFENQKTMPTYTTDGTLRDYYVPGSRYGFTIASADSGVTADDFLVVWTIWPDFDSDENDSRTDTSIGKLSQFGINSIRIAYDESSTSLEIDCAIIRKSDRKAIRFKSNDARTITDSDTSIISDIANYPELQRLRLLGII